PPAPPDAPLLPRPMVRQMGRDGTLMAALGAAGMAIGGPEMAFASLTAAQLSYATTCRAPGTTLDRGFLALVGGAVGLHALAVLSPLRRVLGLGPLSVLEPLGLLVGLILPPLVAGARDGAEIIRRGASAAALVSAPKEATT